MPGSLVFIILEISLFCIFFKVTVNGASVIAKVKFLNRSPWLFDDILGTFHSFYKLYSTFILVFDFEKWSSHTGCLQLTLA